MNQSELFSKARMTRCVELYQAIVDNVQKTNRFEIVLRTTDSVHGITLDEMRKRYFAVGVGSNVKEIPCHDMLVVLTLLANYFEAMKKASSSQKPGSLTMDFTTAFPDAEVVRLLSAIAVETPFDENKACLKFKRAD